MDGTKNVALRTDITALDTETVLQNNLDLNQGTYDKAVKALNEAKAELKGLASDVDDKLK